MDDQSIDRLARMMARGTSRRGGIRAAVGAVVTAIAIGKAVPALACSNKGGPCTSSRDCCGHFDVCSSGVCYDGTPIPTGLFDPPVASSPDPFAEQTTEAVIFGANPLEDQNTQAVIFGSSPYACKPRGQRCVPNSASIPCCDGFCSASTRRCTPYSNPRVRLDAREACTGCWDGDGADFRCRSGETDDSCGASGDRCRVCNQDEFCKNGSCKRVCDHGCMTDADVCVEGNEDAVCGSNGRSCDDCTINNGTCHEGQCRVD